MSGKRYAEEPNSYAFICCAQHAWINACWTEPPVSGGLSPFNRKLFSAERRRKGGLVAGLLYLNRTFALSDEELITRWAENAYWQYFCGETYFQHEPPIHPTSLTRYRQRLGASGCEELLQLTIEDGVAGRVIEERDMAEGLVDTTVMEEAITCPTDSKLYLKSLLGLNQQAKSHGIVLRQSYTENRETAGHRGQPLCACPTVTADAQGTETAKGAAWPRSLRHPAKDGRVVLITGWFGTRPRGRHTVAVSFVSIALIWTANLLEIISVASRAFALYYLLQCVVAIIASRHVQKNQHLNIAGFSVLACILAFVVIFANPAKWSVTSAGINQSRVFYRPT